MCLIKSTGEEGLEPPSTVLETAALPAEPLAHRVAVLSRPTAYCRLLVMVVKERQIPARNTAHALFRWLRIYQRREVVPFMDIRYGNGAFSCILVHIPQAPHFVEGTHCYTMLYSGSDNTFDVLA